MGGSEGGRSHPWPPGVKGMFWILFLLFTVVPAVELYLLVQIGKVLGAGPTVLGVILIGIVGAALARRAGMTVLRQLLDDVRNGNPPSDRIMEGVLVLLGAVLLITPGVLTDLTGLLLLFPPSRRWLAPRVQRLILSRVRVNGIHVGAPAAPQANPRVQSDTPPSPFDHPVV